MAVSVSDFEAGVCLIDKPENVSSFSMVSAVRRLLRIKKVGHAGTLDPFASGLLIICAGRKATRMISEFMDGEKEYIACLALGVRTETFDTEGKIISKKSVGEIPAERITKCLGHFTGYQKQVPPAYSALKHKGKPLYYYARQGIKIEKPARDIFIRELQWLDKRALVSGDTAEIFVKVACSKGTYVRSLADDIGTALGCGAHLKSLRRTKSGCFSVENAVKGQLLYEHEALQLLMTNMISVEEVSKLLQ